MGPEALVDRLSRGALVRAWGHVRRRGDRAPDLDRLWREVRGGRYRPGRPRIRERKKRSGGTRRLVVPSLRDRVLQRAVLDVVPSAVRRVRREVHGYVRGRSPGTAVAGLRAAVGQRRWLEVVQIDVANLFDDLEHDRLAAVIRERWADPLFVRLCGLWMRAYGARGRGVGQGPPIAPLLANLFLDRHLDPAIACAADAGWIRYGDDVTACSAQEGGALWVFAAMELACAAVGLRLAMRKVTVCTAEEGGDVRVLGHTVRLERSGDAWGLQSVQKRGRVP